MKRTVCTLALSLIFYSAFAGGLNGFNTLKKIITVGDSSNTVIRKTFTDPGNNIYVYGETHDTGIASPGAYQKKLVGTKGIFLARYDSNGVKNWATYYGANDSAQTIEGIFTDNGRIAICGKIGPKYNDKGFIAVFDSSGGFMWADTLPSPYILLNISSDTKGNIFAAAIWLRDGWLTYIWDKTLIRQYDTTGKLMYSVLRPAVHIDHPYLAGNDVIKSYLDKKGNFYVLAGSFDSTCACGGTKDFYDCEFMTKYHFKGIVDTTLLGIYYASSGPVDFSSDGFIVDKNDNAYILSGQSGTGSYWGLTLKATKGSYIDTTNEFTSLAKLGPSLREVGNSFPFHGDEAYLGNMAVDKLGNVFFGIEKYYTGFADSQIVGEVNSAMTKRNTLPINLPMTYSQNELMTFDNSNNLIYTSDNKVWKVTSSCQMAFNIKGHNFGILSDTATYLYNHIPFNKYTWKISNGKIISISKDTIKVVWNKPGNGYLRLIGKSPYGCVDSMTYPAFVDNSPVWPGDANYDKIINVKDLLNIGAGYGKTGPARRSASISWYAQPCPDWKDTFTHAVNYKQADCNGDSTINYSDTLAIAANYSKTHLKTITVNQGKPTDPPLYFAFSKDSAQPGDAVDVDILYGSSSIPAANTYGLAFSLLYNASLIESITPDFNSSWLASKPLAMAVAPSTGQLDIGAVRTNQKDTSGFGKLATLHIKIASTLPSGYHNLVFSLADNLQVNSQLQYKPVYLQNDSILVKQTFTGINGAVNTAMSNIKISPNPVSDILHIEITGNTEAQNMSIYDMEGRTVKSFQLSKSWKVYEEDVSKLAKGMYLLRVQSREGVAVKRFLKE